jgi:MFS family permease
MGNVLSSYIFLIAGESNELLGLTSAITGLAMTATVLPAGFLTDKLSRTKMLRIASLFGFLGLFCAFLASDLFLIFFALLFWGFFQGINRPALESIFADSVESGNRSNIYSWAHLVRQFAMATGPFVNALLFLLIGDVWKIEVLKSVMIFGILISLISLSFLFLFDDKKSLGVESEHINGNGNNNQNNHMNTISRTHQFIMFILMLSNLIIGFGAGMTIKFFPIFFMIQYELFPISVQMIMGVTSIFTGFASLLTQKYSLEKGRAFMIFGVQAIATVCLFLIALYPPIWILVPIFITRGALMNASQPLSRSILMDVVPKKHRGKVNSFQALAWGLFWNMSAAIGGFLVGPNNNFQLCFIITATVYVVGTLPILVLIPLVSKEKQKS